MAVIRISNTGGNWNSTSTWDGGVVPISTDSISGDSSSGNLTVNVTATIAFMDLTNYASTLNFQATLAIGGASQTTVLGTNMIITGNTTNGILQCAVAHTFTQNNTYQIPFLRFGAGTRTLNTDLYCFNFASFSTTALANGNRIFIYGSPSFSGGRFAGTSEYVLAGTGTITQGVLANQIGKLTIDTTGTITCNNQLVLYSNSTFKYIQGTLYFPNANTTQTGILCGGVAGSTNTIILNTGQTFDFTFLKNDISIANPLTYNIQPYTGTTVTLGNVEIYGSILLHSITSNSGSTVNIDRLFLTGYGVQSSSINTLSFQTDRTYQINNIYAITSPSQTTGTIPSSSCNTIKSTVTSGSTSLNLLDGTKSSLSFINFTDVNASGGNNIRTLEGVLTRTTNITSTTSTIGGGGASNYTFIS